LGGGEDSALGEGSKRPRLHSPTLPAFRNAKGHSYEAPTSPPAPHQAYNAQTRFGEDIDDHDGDTGAVGLHLDRNTTISCAARVVVILNPSLKFFLSSSHLWGRIHANADELDGGTSSNPALFRECLEYHNRP
jgi:hypothetical protein